MKPGGTGDAYDRGFREPARGDSEDPVDERERDHDRDRSADDGHPCERPRVVAIRHRGTAYGTDPR